MTPQRQSLEQLQQHQQLQMQRVRNSGFLSFNESPIKDENDEVSRSALAAFMSKEEEIERRKTEVKEKVKNHLGRVEEASKRLAEILDELEALTDPMRKEVGIVRKKIDIVNRELKPLGLSCQKKEREYKEVLEAFNERSKEKAQLVARLMELVSESEKLRMKKLEELSKSIESLR